MLILPIKMDLLFKEIAQLAELSAIGEIAI